MEDIKIYKICDCNYVVTKLSKEDTKDWYKKEFGTKVNLNEMRECDLDKEGMLWGSLEEYISFREAIKRSSEYASFINPCVIASTEY